MNFLANSIYRCWFPRRSIPKVWGRPRRLAAALGGFAAQLRCQLFQEGISSSVQPASSPGLWYPLPRYITDKDFWFMTLLFLLDCESALPELSFISGIEHGLNDQSAQWINDFQPFLVFSKVLGADQKHTGWCPSKSQWLEQNPSVSVNGTVAWARCGTLAFSWPCFWPFAPLCYYCSFLAVLLPPKWECGIMHCSVIPAVNPQDSDGASVSLCLMELPAFEGTISREQGRWLQGFWPLALSGDLVPLCLPGYCSRPWTLWSWQIAFTTSRRYWQGGFFGCRKCEEIESKHIKLFLSILNGHLDVQSAL